MEHHPLFSLRPLSAAYPEPEDPPSESRRWILVQGSSVIYAPGQAPRSLFFTGALPAEVSPESVQYLARHDGVFYYAAELQSGVALPSNLVSAPVRELSGKMPDRDLALAAYAVRIIEFNRSNRFCGRCGARTRPLRTERARLCSDCNRIVYPRLSPAIIVLIRKSNEVLLARSPHFAPGIYSVIAGFVEPGENLEEAVCREVNEEVGISVRNIRYLASEPWPFPDSLMIGFSADYAGGEITIDNNEIESAGWFTRDNLPDIPSKMSISRALIDAWVQGEI